MTLSTPLFHQDMCEWGAAVLAKYSLNLGRWGLMKAGIKSMEPYIVLWDSTPSHRLY
jgi:hypothetical protein